MVGVLNKAGKAEALVSGISRDPAQISGQGSVSDPVEGVLETRITLIKRS